MNFQKYHENPPKSLDRADFAPYLASRVTGLEVLVRARGVGERRRDGPWQRHGRSPSRRDARGVSGDQGDDSRGTYRRHLAQLP